MRIIAAGLLLTVLAAPAAAQFQDSAGNCFTGTGSFRLDIRECSIALADPALADASRASLRAMRGRAYMESGALDAAVADFDAALVLNPASAFALTERGRARHKAGDNEAALRDYDAALSLSPQYAIAMRNRGVAHLFTGRLEEAAADFDTAIAAVRYDPSSIALRGIVRYLQGDDARAAADISTTLEQSYPWPQGALWRYLAQRRSGMDGQADLRRYREAMKPGAWPIPLIKTFLGEQDTDAALAAARQAPAADRSRQILEAGFYLGERARLNGDVDTARKLLEAVIAEGPKDAVERAAAKHAISTLKR